jgi:hypothetical protein
MEGPMTQREQIEEQIREVLATETRAIPFSNKLFSQGGLFSQLATTIEERRALVQSDLFKEANRRLSVLQQQEATVFAQAVEQVRDALSASGYRLKMEGEP